MRIKKFETVSQLQLDLDSALAANVRLASENERLRAALEAQGAPLLAAAAVTATASAGPSSPASAAGAAAPSCGPAAAAAAAPAAVGGKRRPPLSVSFGQAPAPATSAPAGTRGARPAARHPCDSGSTGVPAASNGSASLSGCPSAGTAHHPPAPPPALAPAPPPPLALVRLAQHGALASAAGSAFPPHPAATAAAAGWQLDRSRSAPASAFAAQQWPLAHAHGVSAFGPYGAAAEPESCCDAPPPLLGHPLKQRRLSVDDGSALAQSSCFSAPSHQPRAAVAPVQSQGAAPAGWRAPHVGAGDASSDDEDDGLLVDASALKWLNCGGPAAEPLTRPAGLSPSDGVGAAVGSDCGCVCGVGAALAPLLMADADGSADRGAALAAPAAAAPPPTDAPYGAAALAPAPWDDLDLLLDECLGAVPPAGGDGQAWSAQAQAPVRLAVTPLPQPRQAAFGAASCEALQAPVPMPVDHRPSLYGLPAAQPQHHLPAVAQQGGGWAGCGPPAAVAPYAPLMPPEWVTAAAAAAASARNELNAAAAAAGTGHAGTSAGWPQQEAGAWSYSQGGWGAPGPGPAYGLAASLDCPMSAQSSGAAPL
jgi:hypothetical protein